MEVCIGDDVEAVECVEGKRLMLYYYILGSS